MRGPQSQLHKHREANTNSWRDNVNSSVECTVSQTRVTVQHPPTSPHKTLCGLNYTQLNLLPPPTWLTLTLCPTTQHHRGTAWPTGHVPARLVPRTWHGRRHFVFPKIRKNFNDRSAVRGQYSSLYQILSKSVKRLQRYGDLTVFFFKMAAVRHLGFAGRRLGPPATTSSWSLSLCKIWLKSMQ